MIVKTQIRKIVQNCIPKEKRYLTTHLRDGIKAETA